MERKQPAAGIFTVCAGVMRNILNIIVSAYMLLVVAVMPFYFQEGYTHIGSDKSYFFRTWTTRAARVFLAVSAVYLAVLLAGWITDFLSGREKSQHSFEKLAEDFKKSMSITDLFAVCYALSVMVSYVCSNYKETALWGSTGWYMGMVPQLMLVGIYFAVSRFWKWKKKEWMIYLFLIVSSVVFVLGIINRFGWYPLPMENSGLPGFISTIGNINWYCGYVVCVLFLGVGMFWTIPAGRRIPAVLLAIYLLTGFATLVTQGSESGIFALAAVILVMFFMSAQGGKQMLVRFWQILLILSTSCLAVFIVRKLLPEQMNYTSSLGDLLTGSLFPAGLAFLAILVLIVLWMDREYRTGRPVQILAYVVCAAVLLSVAVYVVMLVWNTLQPGVIGQLSESSLFVFQPGWGSNRGATWSAGARCFLEQDLSHKLTGIGPDCMWDYISQDGSRDLLVMVESVFGQGNRLTNAHCEWLTILADTGILGFVSFAGFMVSAMIRFLGHRGKSRLAVMCGLCLLAYTANNLWSFQQSMSVATIFVILGMGEAQ